ncbi:hypothetical protein BASA81_010305 [Batrachochytrium salamandrivorans]|nr:hypothetical protein BASA81_010305 [Batrachochytrium salamandrivorans]
MMKRARIEDGDGETKEVIFPKSQFEYDYAQEKQFASDSGLQIRSLLGLLKSTPVMPTPPPPQVEEEEEELLPMQLPKAAPLNSSSSTKAVATATTTIAEQATSQNFSLKEWVTPASSKKSSNVSTTPLITLHNEIISYRNFVMPNQQELDERMEVVNKVRKLAVELWPKSQTDVFGSFATGLCLPESDVDISVFNVPKNAIQQLSREFSNRKMTDWMEVISKAKVPIIKLKFKGSKYPCDVCFDQIGGLQTAMLIKRVCSELPEVKCLVLVIKHFLAQRNLNNTYQGGMGSYLCFLTCVALVQRCRKLFDPHRLNLGFLLLEYFNFYGHVLDFERVGISLLDGGTFYLKNTRSFFDGERPFLLSMEDPVNPDNDVGRNSRSMSMIKRAFGLAHTELKNKLENSKDGLVRRIGLNTSGMILTCVIRLNQSPNVTELSDDDDDDEAIVISDEEEDEVTSTSSQAASSGEE